MPDQNKYVHIFSPGCPMREVDADKIKKFLIEKGYSFTDHPAIADDIIIMTCGLNKNQIARSSKTIRDFSLMGKRIIITGCLPDIAPNQIQAQGDYHFVSLKNLEEISELFNVPASDYKKTSDSHLYNSDELPPGKDEYYRFRDLFKGIALNKDYYYRLRRRLRLLSLKGLANKNGKLKKCSIRICDGCNFNCSYCGIKYAVGKLRSKTIAECTAEYELLLKQGYHNFIFLADDTGAYGLDIGQTLPALFDHLDKISQDSEIKWFLQEINPFWAIRYEKEFSELIEKKRFYELLIAMQSGSDRILKLMNRGYDSATTLKILQKFKKSDPYLRLCNNFIVGFPTETDEDHYDTLQFVKEIKFDFIYLMPYYENEVCKSSALFPKVPKDIVEKRISEFEKLLKKQKTPYYVVR